MGREPKPRLLRFVREAGAPSRLARLNVYASAYHSRLVEALEAWYPSLKKACDRFMGEGAFTHLGARYLWSHPSKSPNITDFGAKLPSFVATHPFGKEAPWLRDLARLEWACLEALHTPVAPGIDPRRLADTPARKWAQARLGLDPAARLLHSKWEILPFWRNVPSAEAFEPPSRGPSWYGVFRGPDLWYEVSPLSRAQYDALSAFRTGMTLGRATTHLASRHGEELPLGEWLREWLARGWIRSVRFSKERER